MTVNTGPNSIIATAAEIRLADLVHAVASVVPEDPGARYRGRWVFASAIWTVILGRRGSLLWHAFANLAHWGDADRGDGGYGLKAWLSHASRLRDDAGVPLVLLGDARGATDADRDAVMRSEFYGLSDRDDPGSTWVTFHFLVDRARDPGAYLARRVAPARARSIFAPPRHPPTREASDAPPRSDVTPTGGGGR